ncbi:MAG: transposase [Anaerolineae bacterium]|nr:transposase [Anaerolineae bacterium]
MNTLAYKFSYRRNLPHIQPPGATLFVTFRLANSVPKAVMDALYAESLEIENILKNISDETERAKRRYQEQKRLFGKWDKVLDAAEEGPVWLQEPEIARLVADSIHYRNHKVYDLEAFCIMPNHVHMVFTPLVKEEKEYHSLSAIMHSLKLYTSREANDLLQRNGGFWQHENYDHVVRDEAEQNRIITYVLNNPVKAGLVQYWEEWPWTYCKHF